MTAEGWKVYSGSEVLRCEDVSRESMTGRNMPQEDSIFCGVIYVSGDLFQFFCDHLLQRRFVSVAKNPQNKKRARAQQRQERSVAEGPVCCRRIGGPPREHSIHTQHQRLRTVEKRPWLMPKTHRS